MRLLRGRTSMTRSVVSGLRARRRRRCDRRQALQSGSSSMLVVGERAEAAQRWLLLQMRGHSDGALLALVADCAALGSFRAASGPSTTASRGRTWRRSDGRRCPCGCPCSGWCGRCRRSPAGFEEDGLTSVLRRNSSAAVRPAGPAPMMMALFDAVFSIAVLERQRRTLWAQRKRMDAMFRLRAAPYDEGEGALRAASMVTWSPWRTVPSRILMASLSCTRRWMARLSGRAP